MLKLGYITSYKIYIKKSGIYCMPKCKTVWAAVKGYKDNSKRWWMPQVCCSINSFPMVFSEGCPGSKLLTSIYRLLRPHTGKAQAQIFALNWEMPQTARDLHRQNNFFWRRAKSRRRMSKFATSKPLQQKEFYQNTVQNYFTEQG